MITIKTEDEIKIMREAGRILAEVMKKIEKMAVPGIATIELDRAAEALILSRGAKPAFKGYSNFPNSLCASVNDEIVHGIPSARVLKEGDIIGLDLGVLYRGFYSDMAVTVPIGNVSYEAKRLINATKKALRLGIKKARPGNTIGDISNTIQRFIEGQSFGVVRELCGHGIGKNLHEDPKIPNYGKRGEGEVLREGMAICIEPMVTTGNWHLKKSSDGFGYTTKDGSLAAHFEYTILITKSGAKVLTKI